MILIEDTHDVVHVAESSTDASHWTFCGVQMSGDGHEYLGELRGAMGALLRSVVVPAGRYVDRAPTCLWCMRERWRPLVSFCSYEWVGPAVVNPSLPSKVDFSVLEGLVPNEGDPT